jgi:predicted GNAT superfamily acetyltransferase
VLYANALWLQVGDAYSMSFTVEPGIAADQARTAAARAALRAGVNIVDVQEMDRFHDIDTLFKTVWGLTSTCGPIPAELLRSMSHGGASITAAYDAENSLRGAAVLIGSATDPSVYSLIAGVLPRAVERGVGFAIKQHQRAVALARGIDRMRWTFDPLVSRNARFNLTKLGASANEYIENFYGQMQGAINANDETDRLVAIWQLNSERAISASEGRIPDPQRLAFGRSDVRASGPDGAPVLVDSAGSLWCRIPHDVVALRHQNPELAAAWRSCIRTVLSTAFASGYGATWVSRDGWYRLAIEGE